MCHREPGIGVWRVIAKLKSNMSSIQCSLVHGKSHESWSFDKWKSCEQPKPSTGLTSEQAGDKSSTTLRRSSSEQLLPCSTRNSKDLERARGWRMQSSFPTAAGEMDQVSSCRHLRTCLYLALMLIHSSCGLCSSGMGVFCSFSS